MKITHASTKHAQTNGILERTHASIKTALKTSTSERRSMWHKYAQIAVINYNTVYHETLGCEPSTVFHGRIPYNVLDLKLGNKPKWKTTPNSDLRYLRNPKSWYSVDKFAFKGCIWTAPYIEIKVLPNTNYTIRKTGTRYTQTLHRIRKRPYTPEQRMPDVTVRSNEYLPDPDVKI